MAADWGFWWTLGIGAAALVVNGLFATLEDDLPGGFNNPDGKSTPKYAVVVGWIARFMSPLAGVLIIAMLGVNYWQAR